MPINPASRINIACMSKPVKKILLKKTHETITNTTFYFNKSFKISVDKVEISGVKTAQITKGYLNNKLVKTIIDVFDKNGNFKEKHTISRSK